MTDRRCVKDYDLKYDGKIMRFKKNDTLILIPIWSFHHNSKYFPDHEKFKPERFSEENRGNINPNTYLPFGKICLIFFIA